MKLITEVTQSWELFTATVERFARLLILLEADKFGHTWANASLEVLNLFLNWGINPDEYKMNQQHQSPAETCAKYFIYHGLLSSDVRIGTHLHLYFVLSHLLCCKESVLLGQGKSIKGNSLNYLKRKEWMEFAFRNSLEVEGKELTYACTYI